jgi:hypothetical protein
VQHGMIDGLSADQPFAWRLGAGVAIYPIYLYFNFSGYTDFVIGRRAGLAPGTARPTPSCSTACCRGSASASTSCTSLAWLGGWARSRIARSVPTALPLLHPQPHLHLVQLHPALVLVGLAAA